MVRPPELPDATPAFLATRDPTGRFEARPRLAPRLFAPGFDPRDDRQRELALRDAGPVRVFRLGPEGEHEMARLSPPAESWSFGAELAFASSGEALFVGAPDLGRIFAYAHQRGEWVLVDTIREPRALSHGWSARQRFVLVDDDHVWTRHHLFRRASEGFRREREVPRPLAATRDWTTALFEHLGPSTPFGLRIAQGTPYAWERFADVVPWGHVTGARLEDAGARLALTIGDVPVVIERLRVRGWVQRGPLADPAHRVRIVQPPPELTAADFAEARATAPSWSASAAPEAGVWLRHPKLGVGYVLTRDDAARCVVVRFEDGSERRLALR